MIFERIFSYACRVYRSHSEKMVAMDHEPVPESGDVNQNKRSYKIQFTKTGRITMRSTKHKDGQHNNTTNTCKTKGKDKIIIFAN